MKPFPLTDGYAVFSQLLNELLKGALLLASCISYRVFMRLFKRGDYSYLKSLGLQGEGNISICSWNTLDYKIAFI